MFDFKKFIREVPDWPKPGVNFKDITPLLQDKDGFQAVIDELAKLCDGEKIDTVVGIDARGFIFASALAYKLKAGLAIVRKKGKLPRKTVSREYALEYASSIIEMHTDTIRPGERVLLVDDVLATGGTMAAACELVEELGGKIIGINFVIDLTFLKGAEKLKKYSVKSLVQY